MSNSKRKVFGYSLERPLKIGRANGEKIFMGATSWSLIGNSKVIISSYFEPIPSSSAMFYRGFINSPYATNSIEKMKPCTK
jgi:hypothetical protein